MKADAIVHRPLEEIMIAASLARLGLAIVVAVVAAALISLSNAQPAQAEAGTAVTPKYSTIEPGHI